MSSEDEENFYKNLDDYKELLKDDEEGSSAIFFSDEDIEMPDATRRKRYHSDNFEDDAVDFKLLAEFSDEGEFSEDNYSGDDFMDAVRAAKNFKPKKKEKKKPNAPRRKERELDPEVNQLLSEANEAFVRNDIQVAEHLYNEVIKKDNKNFSAYRTLGEIYQIQGRNNDCCNTWFLAAHINSWDADFWKTVADLSAELGHNRQAIYCYTRVISLDNTDMDALYNRALLYKQVGQVGRALENLQRVFKTRPYDPEILRELAVIYLDYNRVNDAISMYLKIYERNVDQRLKEQGKATTNAESEDNDDFDEEDEDESNRYITFDWSALNILSELFLKQESELLGIKTIKRASRWIQFREDQTFWEDAGDDSEFDARRFGVAKSESLPESEKEKEYNLPIDIRVRLGLLRLHAKHYAEAFKHFEFLFEENILEISDLYFEVAQALAKMEQPQESIKFYEPLLALADFQTIEMYSALAKCYTEAENFDRAKEMYEQTLQMDPTNLDVKLALAEVHYFLGDKDAFQEMLHEVVEERRKQHNEDEKRDNTAKTESGKAEPLLQNIVYTKTKKKRTLQDRQREKMEKENRLTKKVLEKYKKLDIYSNGTDVEKSIWLETALELIEIFTNVKNFFLKDRSRKFKGIVHKSKKYTQDIDSKIARLSKVFEGYDDFLESKITVTSTTELRGLSYDQWFDLFMQVAIVVSKVEGAEDGMSVIETAQNVNVFYQNEDRATIMRFVKFAIALQTEDEQEMMECARLLLNQYQFDREILQMFQISIPSGLNCVEMFASPAHQKFFLRQIKAYDSIKQGGKVIKGAAGIVNTAVHNIPMDSPYLYHIYGSFLFVSRSYVSSLVYFKKLLKMANRDPMVNLLTGLAHLHRAMQRLSINRHNEILQGFKYLFDYHAIRNSRYSSVEGQEADYNIGRAFHLLGLSNLALKYYNMVLENYAHEPLKRHAAYNSILIYNSSGNTLMSDMLMDKYLTI